MAVDYGGLYQLDRVDIVPYSCFMCNFETCDRPRYKAQNWCEPHYRQQLRGKPLKPLRPRGPNIGGELGGLVNGYRRLYMPEHPNAQQRGYIYEHIVVMSKLLGRPLLPGENVHHKNGVRHDNRPENLELWVISQPAGQRVEDKVQYAQEILSLYAPELLA